MVSDLVDHFCRGRSWKFNVKIRTGTWSNRCQKLPPKSWWRRPDLAVSSSPNIFWGNVGTGDVTLDASVTSPVPGVENSTVRNRFTKAGRPRSDSADHEHFKSLTWPCLMAMWHHWRYKLPHMPFFAVCLTDFPLEFRPWTFTNGFFGKIYLTRVYDFGVQFSLHCLQSRFTNFWLNEIFAVFVLVRRWCSIKLKVHCHAIRQLFCDILWWGIIMYIFLNEACATSPLHAVYRSVHCNA